MSASVVTSTPTIMDGYVVRWFFDEGHANRREPYLSASRERVVVHTPSPEAIRDEPVAQKVHEWIRDWYRRGGHDYQVWERVVTHDAPFLGDVVARGAAS